MTFIRLTRIDKNGDLHEIFFNMANIAWIEDDHSDESQPRCKIVQFNALPPFFVTEPANYIMFGKAAINK